MKKLMNMKLYLQEDSKEEKVNTKEKCLLFVLNCHEVGHITARCPKKKNRRNDRVEDDYKSREEKYENKYKSRKDDDYKSNKDKGKKSCYVAKKESDSESDKIEVVYVTMKGNLDEDTIALISYVNKDDKWIIDSGFSHHMTGDKNKFKTFENCDGNSVKFGNDSPLL